MNKQEFFDSYKDKGWKLRKVGDWALTREEGGVKYYDIDTKDPNKSVGVIQVSVLNEGMTNTEGKVIEQVDPVLATVNLVPFSVALRDFLDEQEKASPSTYAITIVEEKPEDELATVLVYTESGNDVTSKTKVVVRRDTVFSIKALK